MNLESLFLQDYDAYVQFINKYYKVMKVPADFEIKELSSKKTAFQTKALRLQRIEALFEENPKIELTADNISSITGFSKMQTIRDMNTLLEQKPQEYELLERKRLVPYRSYKKQLKKVLILRKVQS